MSLYHNQYKYHAVNNSQMSTWNAKPIRPKQPALAEMTDRRLLGEIKFHYQIARHLDEQLDRAYRETIGGERCSELYLNQMTAERDTAHEILRIYLTENLNRRKQASIDRSAMPTR